MIQNDHIYRIILHNMSDGVMTALQKTGQIVVFNAAAEQILGLQADDVLDRHFGDVFLHRQENDDFNQAVLDAVYERSKTHRSMVTYHSPAGDVRTLMITASYLDVPDADEKNAAVIVVFSDISEIERLQASELNLAGELKARHRDLQQAYQSLEDANAALAGAAKKVKQVWSGATALVILLFLSVGLFTWHRSAETGQPRQMKTAGNDGKSILRTIPVTVRNLKDSITLKGTLKPVKIVNLTSPFSGRVEEKYFDYGQSVERGQLLMKLDTNDVQSRYREAQNAHAKATEKLREMNDWERSNDMVKAARSVTHAKLALDNQQRSFHETDSLFQKGIVSAMEHENAKQQLASAVMNHETALQEQKITRSKGLGINLVIARNELENARMKMEDLERQMNMAAIFAPVIGTILLPNITTNADKNSKIIEVGTPASEGQILLTIGNTEGFSVTSAIDETEVLKVKIDQNARITTESFTDLSLGGKVTHVSTQAATGGSMGSPSAHFDITVTTNDIPSEIRPKLRLGMSCNVEIVVFDKPGVVMVPIFAVHTEGREHHVSVIDPETKTPRKVFVETGRTTLDAVEIEKGLNPGDEIVIY